MGVTVAAMGATAIFLIAGLAQAGPVTLLAPYTGVPILNAPKTWNVGTGFIKWPVAVNANLVTGKAGYDVWARSTQSATGGTHGSDNTQAGFNITVNCGPCIGDTIVNFNWQITWNATMDLTCVGGSVNNQFGVDGQVYDHTGASLGYTPVHIWWKSSVAVPTHLTGSQTNALYTVGVSIAPAVFAAGTYYLHTWLFSEVYTQCGTGALGPYANSELNVATPGGQGGTLLSVQIS